MNCNGCPYQDQIEKLRRRCLACNPDDDAGTPHGRVKADDYTLNTVPKAQDFDRTPSGQATNLSPADEHKLRLAMSSLFSLDPVDLMLVQHLMQGRSLESFSETMTGVVDKIRHYHGSPRAMAWARKENILRKFPQFAAVIKNDHEWNAANRVENSIIDIQKQPKEQ